MILRLQRQLGIGVGEDDLGRVDLHRDADGLSFGDHRTELVAKHCLKRVAGHIRTDLFDDVVASLGQLNQVGGAAAGQRVHGNVCRLDKRLNAVIQAIDVEGVDIAAGKAGGGVNDLSDPKCAIEDGHPAGGAVDHDVSGRHGKVILAVAQCEDRHDCAGRGARSGPAGEDLAECHGRCAEDDVLLADLVGVLPVLRAVHVVGDFVGDDGGREQRGGALDVDFAGCGHGEGAVRVEGHRRAGRC